MRKRTKIEAPIVVDMKTIGTFKAKENADKLAAALIAANIPLKQWHRVYHHVDVATTDASSAYEILYSLFPLK